MELFRYPEEKPCGRSSAGNGGAVAEGYKCNFPKRNSAAVPRDAGLLIWCHGCWRISEPLTVPAAAGVEIENLSFAYGSEPVFSGLSLTVQPGDIIGVTGPVACGKSTLGQAFLCEAPYGGSVKFGGKELSALTPRQIAATVGYLGHDPELSADTMPQ